jgi:Na+/proline symporter
VDDDEPKSGKAAEPQFTVRYSPKFLRAQAQEMRRSWIIGGVLCLLAAISMIAEGVEAWRTNSMVDLGPRMSFLKSPPELVIPMGLLAFVIGAYALWCGIFTRVSRKR